MATHETLLFQSIGPFIPTDCSRLTRTTAALRGWWTTRPGRSSSRTSTTRWDATLARRTGGGRNINIDRDRDLRGRDMVNEIYEDETSGGRAIKNRLASQRQDGGGNDG